MSFLVSHVGHMFVLIVRVLDNDGRNLKLDQAEYIDIGSLNRDSAFTFAAWRARKDSSKGNSAFSSFKGF